MQLRSGFDYFGDAFGEGPNFDREAAREAWVDHRDDLLAEQAQLHADHPNSYDPLPWAFHEFESEEAKEAKP